MNCCKKCKRNHDYGPQSVSEDAPAYFCGATQCECHENDQEKRLEASLDNITR